jgi:hypothetical protein
MASPKLADLCCCGHERGLHNHATGFCLAADCWCLVFHTEEKKDREPEADQHLPAAR